jgi:isopenicillin N synthase-like dioxygenase
MAAMTSLGHALMEGVARALGLAPGFFRERIMADPLVLFRIFHYPAMPPSPDGAPVVGVGEHTDYGVLTILRQDDVGGLEVFAKDRWIDVAPQAGAFVCNLGDMLERMTGGRFRSTPHRVENRSGRSRLSFPFFFDPGWDAVMAPLPGCEEPEGGSPARARWDGADPLAFQGPYGDYVLAKVAKVFPALGGAVL